MAATDAQTVRESLAFACFACFAGMSMLLGALLVLFISRPTLKPRLYGVLKSFLAGAVGVVMAFDMLDWRLSPNGWAYHFGGAMTAFVTAPLIINPPSGPNKLHPSVTKEELDTLQRLEFDSPEVRERARIGGMVAAVSIGFRNLAYGVWTFSFLTWRPSSDPIVVISSQAAFVTLGAAVAVPIYFGTESRSRAIQAVVASTAAYPLGQCLAAWARPSPTVVSKLLEFQAGSMSAMVIYWMSMTSLETTPWRQCMTAGLLGLVCMVGIRSMAIDWGFTNM